LRTKDKKNLTLQEHDVADGDDDDDDNDDDLVKFYWETVSVSHYM